MLEDVNKLVKGRVFRSDLFGRIAGTPVHDINRQPHSQRLFECENGVEAPGQMLLFVQNGNGDIDVFRIAMEDARHRLASRGQERRTGLWALIRCRQSTCDAWTLRSEERRVGKERRS